MTTLWPGGKCILATIYLKLAENPEGLWVVVFKKIPLHESTYFNNEIVL